MPFEFELSKRVFLKRKGEIEFVEHKKHCTIQIQLGDVLRFTRDEPFVEYIVQMPPQSTPLKLKRQRKEEEEERSQKRRRIIECGENNTVPFDAFLGFDVMKSLLNLSSENCEEIRRTLLVSGAVRESDSDLLVLNEHYKRYLENLSERSPWLVLTNKMKTALGIRISNKTTKFDTGRT